MGIFTRFIIFDIRKDLGHMSMKTTMKKRGAAVIDKEKCKGCAICLDACPQKIIVMSDKFNAKGYRYAYVQDNDKCTGCANCAIVCPDGVIEVYREKE